MLTYKNREQAIEQRNQILAAAGIEFAVIVESQFASGIDGQRLFVPRGTASIWLDYDYRVRNGERVWEQSELDTPIPDDATEAELNAVTAVEYFPPSGPHFGDQVPEVWTRIVDATRGYWINQARQGNCELR